MVNNWWKGIVFLQIVVICWITSSFLLSRLFKTYNHPIFVTYCSVSACSVYLLPLLKKTLQQYLERYISKDKPLRKSGNTIHLNDSNEEDNDIVSENTVPIGYIMKLSLIFGTIWFLANLTTNASLSYTTVTLQTILSSTASFFTLLFSVLLQIDRINCKRLFGIILSFTGIVLIVLNKDTAGNNISAGSDDNSIDIEKKNIIVGNLLAIMGAMIYGCYSSLFKLNISGSQMKKKNSYRTNDNITTTVTATNEKLPSVQIIIGFIGFFTMVVLWPVIFIADYLNIENFELPTDSITILLIAINCIITIISNYCWASAIKNTTPLTVTVGLSFTIPLSMIMEFLINLHSNNEGNLTGDQLNAKYFFGAILILISFVLINYDSDEDVENLASNKVAKGNDELSQLCEKQDTNYDSIV